MLLTNNRLPKEEIANVMRRGIHRRNDFIELIYKTNTDPRMREDDKNTSRFCFIVSTKIDKRATQRNRMRRTMSESVRHLLPHIQPIDGIFVVKKNFAEFPQTDVENSIRELLHL